MKSTQRPPKSFAVQIKRVVISRLEDPHHFNPYNIRTRKIHIDECHFRVFNLNSQVC